LSATCQTSKGRRMGRRRKGAGQSLR
jgi:hypothetical protein